LQNKILKVLAKTQISKAADNMPVGKVSIRKKYDENKISASDPDPELDLDQEPDPSVRSTDPGDPDPDPHQNVTDPQH
jgi:hypothetical protein